MSEQTELSPTMDGERGDSPAVTPVGESLRKAREARNLSQSDVAQTLKLGVRQVDALETGRWEALPGTTFIRGIVRNYARLLQLDVEPLMQQLDRCLIQENNRLSLPEAQPTDMPVSGSRRIARKDRLVVLAGIVLAVAAFLAYSLLGKDLSSFHESLQQMIESASRKEEAPVAETQPGEPVMPPGASTRDVLTPQAAPADAPAGSAAPAAADVPPAPVVVPSATHSPAAAQAPQLRFVIEKESWIEVRDRNNRVVFSQRQPAGSEQALSGSGPLSLIIGYAPGVRLFWHGQAVDLAPHTKGDVARLVLE